MPVVDKIGGSIEEGRIEECGRQEGSQIGGRLAARTWIYSQRQSHATAKISQKPTGTRKFLLGKPLINCVQACIVTTSGFPSFLCAAGNTILEVERGLLWYSAPSSLNHDLLKDGAILEVYNRVSNMGIETFFKFPVTQIQTTRYFFLRVHRLMVG